MRVLLFLVLVAIAYAAYEPYAVENNVDVTTITSGGWTLCQQCVTGSNCGTPEEVAQLCPSDRLLFACGVPDALTHNVVTMTNRSGAVAGGNNDYVDTGTLLHWYTSEIFYLDNENATVPVECSAASGDEAICRRTSNTTAIVSDSYCGSLGFSSSNNAHVLYIYTDTCQNVTNGTSCDTGNLCRTAGVCYAEVCTSPLTNNCSATAQCPPGSNCSADCVASATCDRLSGNCTLSFVTPGGECDADGDSCTVNDACNSFGKCEPGTDFFCLDSDECQPFSYCNGTTLTPQCVYNIRDGFNETCDDGNACTGTALQQDYCSAGNCTAGANRVAPFRSCRNVSAAVCNPNNGGFTYPTFLANGINCTGEITQSNTCFTQCECQAGAPTPVVPVDCSFLLTECGNATTLRCLLGVCLIDPITNGGPCTYIGDSCVQSAECVNAACVPTSRYGCDASTSCKKDVYCDGSGVSPVCVGAGPNRDDGLPCQSSDACVENKFCMTGACTGGNAVDCASILGDCYSGIGCGAATGCFGTPKADGTSCLTDNSCFTSGACASSGGVASCIGALSIDATCQALYGISGCRAMRAMLWRQVFGFI